MCYILCVCDYTRRCVSACECVRVFVYVCMWLWVQGLGSLLPLV